MNKIPKRFLWLYRQQHVTVINILVNWHLFEGIFDKDSMLIVKCVDFLKTSFPVPKFFSKNFCNFQNIFSGISHYANFVILYLNKTCKHNFLFFFLQKTLYSRIYMYVIYCYITEFIYVLYMYICYILLYSRIYIYMLYTVI